MIRAAIMPNGVVIVCGFLAGMMLACETGIALTHRDEKVVASAAHCVGKSLTADRTLTLNVGCDTGKPAHTASAATIKQFAEAPSTRLVCKVRASGNAECAPAKK